METSEEMAESVVETTVTTSQVEEDIKELKTFLDQAQRPRVTELLQSDVKKLEEEAAREKAAASVPRPAAAVPLEKRMPNKTIDSYGWDQSEKFTKIYITLDNLDTVSKDNVKSEFTNRSFMFRIEDLKGKNYELKILRLFDNIIPKDSYHKVKSNMVVIFMKKETPNKTWLHLTEQEKKFKDMKESMKPPSLDGKDPQAGLMEMMKKMYDEGDDEMKRTINKAWSESQEKRNTGGDDFSMPSM